MDDLSPLAFAPGLVRPGVVVDRLGVVVGGWVHFKTGHRVGLAPDVAPRFRLSV